MIDCPPLGIIEGFYGKAWTWSERADLVSFLSEHGYTFYLYAPKADACLRRDWKTDHSTEQQKSLAGFAEHCRKAGVSFGLGLSPFGLFEDFSASNRAALEQKLSMLAGYGINELAVLFDDMPAGQADLAGRQVEIMHWIRDWLTRHSDVSRLQMCPSYYSDDIVLDKVFGQRPDGYLEQLGSELDATIDVFWTGEEVCSKEIGTGHLKRVGQQLRRKPMLWDNYPVNDGQRMSQFLHLRAFSGRPAVIAPLIAGHGINPAVQPVLTRIPALTLVDSYSKGNNYQYGAAFKAAAVQVVGKRFADQLEADLISLQDSGLERISPSRLVSLKHIYTAIHHPAAAEILSWLNGGYRITDDLVSTQ